MTRPGDLDFRVHAVRGGSDEFGRVDFHRMLTALVQIQQPTATEVRADPGDWGIDTFVGSLIDSVSIWQSKYFYDRIGSSQQAQIRESFASAMKHAADHDYRVESWTLCVATTLSAPERKWWDGKVRAWKKEYPRLRIDLWDAPRLRGMLMSPDAEHVLDAFYGPGRDWQAHPAAAAVAAPSPEIAHTPGYEDALFMRQLNVAGATQTDAQRYAFFTAEMLARDIASRSVPAEVAALRDLDHEVHALWEEHWNDPATAPTTADYGPSARRLLVSVLAAVRQMPPAAGLQVPAVHVRGMLHRVVEDGRAGWVFDWQDVAAAHRAGTAAAPTAAAPAGAGVPQAGTP
jgi:hypothetical protein